MITGLGVQTIPDAAKLEILAQAAVSPAAVGPLHGAKVGLQIAVLVPNPATAFANMTEPTWTGYTEQAITWDAPDNTALGACEMLGGTASFTVPTGGVGQTVYGWFVVLSDGSLGSVYMLTAPIAIYAAQIIEVPVIWLWVG